MFESENHGKGRGFPPAFNAAMGNFDEQIGALGRRTTADCERKPLIDSEGLKANLHENRTALTSLLAYQH